MIDPLTFSLLISFLVPALFALPLFLLDGRRADVFMLLGMGLTLTSSLYAFALFLTEGMPTKHVVLIKANGVEYFGLIIDRISMIVTFVVATAGFAFLLYSVEYMSPRNREHPVERGKGRFYAWMLLFVAATLAFVLSSTLIEMLMFFELMSLSCWGVVSFYYTPEARRAALKAFVTTHVGALLGLFVATAICLNSVGDLSLEALTKLEPSEKLIVFAALLVAAITKSAQFPTYSWLPDAMVAPTPASAFLHGAAMIEMGVYLLARGVQFLQPLPMEAANALLAVVCLSLVLTALMYPLQRDAKRLLAYSTIAESATMYAALVPACLGIVDGIYVSIYILALHAYVKGLGFLTTGLFSYYFGEKTIDHVRGLLRKSPFTAFCWIVSLFGLAGLPPMPLFFGKLALFAILAKALANSSTIAILIVVLLIDVASFGITALRWIHENLLSEPSDGAKISLHPIFVSSLSLLLALLFAAPFIATPLVGVVVGW